MKSALLYTLIVCLVAAGVPLAAVGATPEPVAELRFGPGWSGPTSQNNESPLLRAIAHEADRLAAEPASFVAPAPQGDSDKAGPVRLRWNELAPLIQKKRVDVTLTDGTTVRGEAITVRDDALVMDVAGSSNARVYPKGNGPIPRTSVALIRLERMRGSWGRNLGTTIGLLSGLMIGGYVTAQVANSAGTGIPLFLVFASGVTMTGYYAGKSLDRKVTTIRIVP